MRVITRSRFDNSAEGFVCALLFLFAIEAMLCPASVATRA
jgi:hypothetical protein